MDGTLAKSLELRVPLWHPENYPTIQQRAQELEDYILLSSWYRGELAQERQARLAELREKRKRWAHLEPVAVRSKTNAAAEDGKRILDPQLYDRIKELEGEIEDRTEEMDRLDRDATRCNQVWGMIQAGG